MSLALYNGIATTVPQLVLLPFHTPSKEKQNSILRLRSIWVPNSRRDSAQLKSLQFIKFHLEHSICCFRWKFASNLGLYLAGMQMLSDPLEVLVHFVASGKMFYANKCYFHLYGKTIGKWGAECDKKLQQAWSTTFFSWKSLSRKCFSRDGDTTYITNAHDHYTFYLEKKKFCVAWDSMLRAFEVFF